MSLASLPLHSFAAHVDSCALAHLKLVRCPRSLAPTLVALPSMSLIPSALFSFASGYRAIPSGAPRTNHTWEICHSDRPIPGVASEGRHESVAGALCKYGFDDAEELGWREIHV
jgi:hypothetical protein